MLKTEPQPEPFFFYSTLHMPTHNEQNLSREAQCRQGSWFMRAGSQACQPQSRSALLFSQITY